MIESDKATHPQQEQIKGATVVRRTRMIHKYTHHQIRQHSCRHRNSLSRTSRTFVRISIAVALGTVAKVCTSVIGGRSGVSKRVPRFLKPSKLETRIPPN